MISTRHERKSIGSGRRAWRAAAAVAGASALGLATLAPAAAAAPAPNLNVTAVSAPGIRAQARSVAATCPAPPKRPPTSTAFKASGFRWNPSETIKYVVDTARLPSSQVKARVSDARRAMRAAAKYTGLIVSYRGTEAKLLNPMTHPQLVQFEYAHIAGGIGVKPSLYNYAGTIQMFSAIINVQITTKTGYGRYNTAHPEQSAEGHLLLFGVGEADGLKTVKDTYREVMNPVARKHFYFNAYQRGDAYGLWTVGASKGCGGFQH